MIRFLVLYPDLLAWWKLVGNFGCICRTFLRLLKTRASNHFESLPKSCIFANFFCVICMLSVPFFQLSWCGGIFVVIINESNRWWMLKKLMVFHNRCINLFQNLKRKAWIRCYLQSNQDQFCNFSHLRLRCWLFSTFINIRLTTLLAITL